MDPTAEFRLDEERVRAEVGRAAALAGPEQVRRLVERIRAGAAPSLRDALMLWSASDLSADDVYALAVARRPEPPGRLETFSPLYMTNTCDAECRMCGMRRDNASLERRTADVTEVETQLRLLRRRGMHAVALLTGEYRPERRPWAMSYVNRALRAAQDLGFAHVLVNVGSIEADEYDRLFSGLRRRGDGALATKTTMCTFQETYSRETYTRFMGSSPGNPRADFDRRLTNFDRAFRAGMRVANPGILVGLNRELGFELAALVLHARHLLERGMEVYLSVPRLRQIAGGRSQGGVSDADFVRLVSVLALAVPAGKIVITTRESQEIQRRLVPVVSVLSAGSAAVTPYTETSAHFPLEESQFEVIDQRPFEVILDEHRHLRGEIENFRPTA